LFFLCIFKCFFLLKTTTFKYSSEVSARIKEKKVPCGLAGADD